MSASIAISTSSVTFGPLRAVGGAVVSRGVPSHCATSSTAHFLERDGGGSSERLTMRWTPDAGSGTISYVASAVRTKPCTSSVPQET
ncbi:MAG: hypothetical protein U0166_23280 [Acidobacteriota bacterium]